MLETCLLALVSLAVALFVQARLADRASRRHRSGAGRAALRPGQPARH